jgi:hypothetical protein
MVCLTVGLIYRSQNVGYGGGVLAVGPHPDGSDSVVVFRPTPGGGFHDQAEHPVFSLCYTLIVTNRRKSVSGYQYPDARERHIQK